MIMGRYAVGIDIGTTSVSAVVMDLENKRHAESYTVPNGTDQPCADPDMHCQDPEMILAKVYSLLDGITEKYSGICSIGVTGQMHGVLYVDARGRALSPLATWQDRRGDKLYGDTTYVGNIERLTGEKTATGFGLVTHYYNAVNRQLPNDAAKLCSIMDYVAMRLCNRSEPLIHTSTAASFGFFDVAAEDFKRDKLGLLGVSEDILPRVTDDFALIGEYHGIPVAVAIGDNQASFLGTVKDIENTVLVNIGTGSQVSCTTNKAIAEKDTEIRPLVKGKKILCGSALCGGAAYALLERFFREFSIAAGFGDRHVYDVVNCLAEKAYREGKIPLGVATLFSGKRSDPTATGSVTGITTENFTPDSLALGFIFGICRELRDYLGDVTDKSTVVASGNAVQKIGVMPDIIGEVFGLPVKISDGKEEASVGTALFSAIAANELRGIEDIADFIIYK